MGWVRRDSPGLGYAGSAALVAGMRWVPSVSNVALFWVAVVLTRPLGATVGHFFTKPTVKGGLGLGTYGTSAVLLAVLVVGIVVATRRAPRPALRGV